MTTDTTSDRHGQGLAIDRYLATPDVVSHHEILVDAPPTTTYRAMLDLDLGRSLPVLALFAIRTVPRLLTGKARPSRSITLDTMLETGFVILEERPPHELVMGAIGRFWLPTSGVIPVAPEGFREFDEPGYAKGAMTFVVEGSGTGSLLMTETRVVSTDASARRRFGLYWRAIAPFSGGIRRVMLRQIKRAAEGRREDAPAL